MEAVAKTPEREAFYKKIDGENLSALWNVLGDLITPEPKSACRPHLWKFDAIRDLHDRSRQADHRQGSRAAGAGSGKSGLARPVEGHDLAVCRRADGDPGRCCAGASPQPVGVAFHPRRQGRLHLGRWRAHRDGAGRFRHHAVDDLARPLQRNLRADVLARRARYSDGAVLRRLLCRRPEGRPAEDHPPRRRQLCALWPQPAADRREAHIQDLADLQLSLLLHARGAGDRPSSATNGTPATA